MKVESDIWRIAIITRISFGVMLVGFLASGAQAASIITSMMSSTTNSAEYVATINGTNLNIHVEADFSGATGLTALTFQYSTQSTFVVF